MTFKNNLILITLFFSMIAVASANSLYNVSGHWTDESNKQFPLSSLQGKKVIMAMAYTSCQGTCPLIVSKLKRIEALFNEKNIPVEVAIVTYDPEFDTPERHQAFYREKMGIKNVNWHFLNGSHSETRKLSMLLGIKYSRNPSSGMIIHENKVILLDEHGRIKNKLETLDADEKELLK